MVVHHDHITTSTVVTVLSYYRSGILCGVMQRMKRLRAVKLNTSTLYLFIYFCLNIHCSSYNCGFYGVAFIFVSSTEHLLELDLSSQVTRIHTPSILQKASKLIPTVRFKQNHEWDAPTYAINPAVAVQGIKAGFYFPFCSNPSDFCRD